MTAVAPVRVNQQTEARSPGRTMLLQRKCACGNHTIGGEKCGTCAERERSRHGDPDSGESQGVPPVVREVLKSQGNRLDPSIRDAMGARMGRDFSGVRVHADDMAARSAQAVSAQAYTVAPHIVFGRGRYDPSSRQGQGLLAHELTHIAQQRTPAPAGSELRIDPAASPAEQEAEQISRGVADGVSRSPSETRSSSTLSRSIEGAAIGGGIGGAALGAAGAGIGLAASKGQKGWGVFGGIVGGLVGIGGGLLVGDALSRNTDAVPTLSDAKFRERWEKALQEGLNSLETKRPEGCEFPEGEGDKYDKKNWNETTLFPLGGKAYTPKAGTPYDAVAGLFANLDKWKCDCRLFSEIAILYAWYGSLSKEQFNKKFAGFRLTAEDTTGLDRQTIGSGFGETPENAEEVSDSDWHNAPVGSKVVWHNTSEAARVPWQYEHAVKRVKGKNSAEDRYAAQGVGFSVSEDEVKLGIARHSEDFGCTYQVDESVLAKSKAEGASDEVLSELATIKGQTFNTTRDFLRQQPLRNLYKVNEPLFNKVMGFSRRDPPPDKMAAYIRKYIRRDKVEIPK